MFHKRCTCLKRVLYEFACSSVHLLFRIIGSLLSTHLIITDQEQPFGDLKPTDYNNELLMLANDIASRLLPAFENTATGIPFPRVKPLKKKISQLKKKIICIFLCQCSMILHVALNPSKWQCKSKLSHCFIQSMNFGFRNVQNYLFCRSNQIRVYLRTVSMRRVHQGPGLW